MPNNIILEIENDEKLLKEYGRATAYLAFLDYILGEIILLADKTQSREYVINKCTLGSKIETIKKLKRLINIHSQIDILLEDRNKLIHGIIGGINGSYSILHRQKTYNLDCFYLCDVAERVKFVFPEIYKELKNFFSSNNPDLEGPVKTSKITKDSH